MRAMRGAAIAMMNASQTMNNSLFCTPVACPQRCACGAAHREQTDRKKFMSQLNLIKNFACTHDNTRSTAAVLCAAAKRNEPNRLY